MNHLESAFNGKNSYWRYIVMIAVVFIGSNTIGAVPLFVALILKSGSDPAVFSRLAANPNDFSVIGLDSVTVLIMMLLPFIAGLAAFVLLVKPLNNRTFRMIVNGTRRIRWDKFFISATVWLILSGIYLFFYHKLDPANFRINNTTISLIILSVVSVSLVPFQAAFEEVLFRGYLMQGFAVMVRNRWFPLIMTSILFGLLHAFNPEVKEFGFFTMMPQYIIFGLVFGIITILDDGIEASTGAHSANNIFLCIMVTNRTSALQTPALFEQYNIDPWSEFSGLVIMGIAFIIILKMIFKWGDFSLLLGKVGPSVPAKAGRPQIL